jgi:hypothetical protein
MEARFNLPHRTLQSHDSHGQPAIHALNQCIQQESRESRAHARSVLHVLQLLPDSQTLRVTPAMEAGITDHVWELSEVIALLA